MNVLNWIHHEVSYGIRTINNFGSVIVVMWEATMISQWPLSIQNTCTLDILTRRYWKSWLVGRWMGCGIGMSRLVWISPFWYQLELTCQDYNRWRDEDHLNKSWLLIARCFVSWYHLCHHCMLIFRFHVTCKLCRCEWMCSNPPCTNSQ